MSKSKIVLAFVLLVAAVVGTFAMMTSSNAQQLRRAGQCGAFHDGWQTPGSPATMTMMFGIGREIMAARDCLAKGDSSNACEHYRRITSAFGRMESQLAVEQLTNVRAQMGQADCQ